jgi:hypothetical protein
MMPTIFESPIRYEKLKKITVLDKTVLKVCETKEREIGHLRKRLLYTHNNGKAVDLLLTDLSLNHIKYVELC